jgi:hypothetical protein
MRSLEPKPKTYLQRSFAIFESRSALPTTTRTLAALLHCQIESAYNYIVRLKRMKKIQLVQGGTAKAPAYGLVPGATPPPADGRGRKPSRPPDDSSRWKRSTE